MSIKRSRDGTGHVMAETFWQNAEHSGLLCFMSLGPEDGAPEVREVSAHEGDAGLAKVEWARADGCKVSIVFGETQVDRTLDLDLLIQPDLPLPFGGEDR